jgi:hypothetical protein
MSASELRSYRVSVRPVHQVGEQIAEAVFVVATGCLPEGADGPVGPARTVKIRR